MRVKIINPIAGGIPDYFHGVVVEAEVHPADNKYVRFDYDGATWSIRKTHVEIIKRKRCGLCVFLNEHKNSRWA